MRIDTVKTAQTRLDEPQ